MSANADGPNEARVALNIVVNYEEGAERSIPDGDKASEGFGDIRYPVPDGVRDLAARGHGVGSHSHTHPTYMGKLDRPAIAEEWRAQGERIDPLSMPLTRLANSAIDGVACATTRRATAC